MSLNHIVLCLPLLLRLWIFKPDALKDVEEYIADWEHIEPLMILPYQTNKPYWLAAKLIETYQETGIYRKR